MGILDLIANVFKAIANWFGYSQSRSEARNAADVKAAAKGQVEVDAQNDVERAIKRRDLEKLRKDCAE